MILQYICNVTMFPMKNNMRVHACHTVRSLTADNNVALTALTTWPPCKRDTLLLVLECGVSENTIKPQNKGHVVGTI